MRRYVQRILPGRQIKAGLSKGNLNLADESQLFINVTNLQWTEGLVVEVFGSDMLYSVSAKHKLSVGFFLFRARSSLSTNSLSPGVSVYLSAHYRLATGLYVLPMYSNFNPRTIVFSSVDDFISPLLWDRIHQSTTIICCRSLYTCFNFDQTITKSSVHTPNLFSTLRPIRICIQIDEGRRMTCVWAKNHQVVEVKKFRQVYPCFNFNQTINKSSVSTLVLFS